MVEDLAQNIFLYICWSCPVWGSILPFWGPGTERCRVVGNECICCGISRPCVIIFTSGFFLRAKTWVGIVELVGWVYRVRFTCRYGPKHNATFWSSDESHRDFSTPCGGGGATRSLCPYMEVPNVVQSWACVVGGRITIVGSLSHACITRESTLGYVSSGAM